MTLYKDLGGIFGVRVAGQWQGYGAGAGKGKRWFALALLILMIVGATVGELPAVKEAFPEIKLDMFFFVSITTIIMAWTKIFPARKYTKYISWDILITIACAFAISKAMVNSGVADAVAHFIIG